MQFQISVGNRNFSVATENPFLLCGFRFRFGTETFRSLPKILSYYAVSDFGSEPKLFGRYRLSSPTMRCDSKLFATHVFPALHSEVSMYTSEFVSVLRNLHLYCGAQVCITMYHVRAHRLNDGVAPSSSPPTPFTPMYVSSNSSTLPRQNKRSITHIYCQDRINFHHAHGDVLYYRSARRDVKEYPLGMSCIIVARGGT